MDVIRSKDNRYDLKTHCPYGHPLSGDNLTTYVRKSGRDKGTVEKICVTCRRFNSKRWRDKNPDMVDKIPTGPKTHCNFGHELTPENRSTWLSSKTGKVNVDCKICRKASRDVPRRLQ